MTIPFTLVPVASRAFDVVGFGQNSFDLLTIVDAFPARDEKGQVRRIDEQPGGQIATAMAACARLGWRARYIGRFGADRHGAAGLESLRREGVDVAFAETVSGARSHFSQVIVDTASGSRTILWDHDSRLGYTPAEVPLDAVRDGRIFLADCSDVAAATHAASIARSSGMATMLDVEAVCAGVDALLDQMDVIIAAEAFPSAFTGKSTVGEALTALATRFPRATVVCVTLGSAGSLARSGGWEFHTPAFPIDCVDSTGAGDVFRAGFVSGWLRLAPAADLGHILRYANAAAALNCRTLGARDANPTHDEVMALLDGAASVKV